MEENLTAGTKEFVFSVIWTVLLLTAGRYITFILPSYKIAGTILTVLMFCILGFFVLTHYCAVYTYTVKNGKLTVNRAIGHRNKTVTVPLSQITSVTRKKPAGTRRAEYTMKKRVFPGGRECFVTYKRSGKESVIVFEPSAELEAYLKKTVKTQQ